MAIVVEWMVVNKNNPDKVCQRVEEFFDEPEDDKKLEEHIIMEEEFLEDGSLIGKENVMNEDGKSFKHTKYFRDEESHNAYQIARTKLPRVDKHLSYTLLTSYNNKD